MYSWSAQIASGMAYLSEKKERVPWRWLSLESMKNAIFSCQSDIWSYGVTIWEIFSLARTPYPSSYWGVAFITQIENGMRLPRPDYASQQLYDMIMMECWNSDPVRRPSFDIIEDLLKTLCSSVEGSSSYVSTNTLLVNSQTPQTSTGCTPDSSDFDEYHGLVDIVELPHSYIQVLQGPEGSTTPSPFSTSWPWLNSTLGA
ncbi:unnamed protein product [Allacma fusca]|uniref:Protein kinase domain-containing protein n=1 Tax=Allacma fusca TaxID=39272 RepID=A0A8J2JZ97_9HEXA|nr:unnamed protein product [Allacma fusca]